MPFMDHFFAIVIKFSQDKKMAPRFIVFDSLPHTRIKDPDTRPEFFEQVKRLCGAAHVVRHCQDLTRLRQGAKLSLRQVLPEINAVAERVAWVPGFPFMPHQNNFDDCSLYGIQSLVSCATLTGHGIDLFGWRRAASEEEEQLHYGDRYSPLTNVKQGQRKPMWSVDPDWLFFGHWQANRARFVHLFD